MTKKKQYKSCVISLRISQDRDDQQSIENQRRECVAYAEAHGWEVKAILEDVGKSGYKPGVKRPGFDKAMMMVETKQADVFLVWKVSRFIRNLRQFHMFLDRLVKAGGAFDSVRDPVDYATAGGELMLAMLAGLAQIESANKADFAEAWNHGRTANGAVPQGPRPLGYDRIPRDEAVRDARGNLVTLVPNPREAEAISYAATALLEGKSLRSIMKDLKDFPGTKDTKLTTRGLRSALMNPTTAGLRVVKDDDGNEVDKVQGCWEPLLDVDTWYQVQAILGDPARRTSDQPTNVVKHLLSGIMVCGKDGCGQSFGVRKWKSNKLGREGYRYTCFHCNSNSAWKDLIDDAVKARLLELVDQAAWKELKERGRGYDPAVIKAIEAEQMKLAEMWKSGEIQNLDIFQMMNATLVQRMAQATGEEPLDLPDVENLAESWDTMNVVDQRRVLAVVFSEIKLDPANGTRDSLSRLFCRRAV